MTCWHHFVDFHHREKDGTDCLSPRREVNNSIFSAYPEALGTWGLPLGVERWGINWINKQKGTESITSMAGGGRKKVKGSIPLPWQQLLPNPTHCNIGASEGMVSKPPSELSPKSAWIGNELSLLVIWNVVLANSLGLISQRMMEHPCTTSTISLALFTHSCVHISAALVEWMVGVKGACSAQLYCPHSWCDSASRLWCVQTFSPSET